MWRIAQVIDFPCRLLARESPMNRIVALRAVRRALSRAKNGSCARTQYWVCHGRGEPKLGRLFGAVL